MLPRSPRSPRSTPCLLLLAASPALSVLLLLLERPSRLSPSSLLFLSEPLRHASPFSDLLLLYFVFDSSTLISVFHLVRVLQLSFFSLSIIWSFVSLSALQVHFSRIRTFRQPPSLISSLRRFPTTPLSTPGRESGISRGAIRRLRAWTGHSGVAI